MQRFTVPGRGGHIAGLNFGRPNGPLDVVFLHATGFNAQTYRQLLEPLGPGLRVVALDLRGHGHTSLPANSARLTDWHTYASDVVGALRSLAGGGPAGRNAPVARLIAGHSLGGAVALLALATDPTLAAALLMIDPAMIPPRLRRWLLLPFGPKLLRRRLPIARSAARRRPEFATLEEALASYRGRGAFRTWRPGFLEDYVEGAFERPPGGAFRLRCAPDWESATFAAHRHDLRAALRELRVPARLVLAEQGSITTWMLPTIRECAPWLAPEVVPGSTHFVPMEHPERVRDAILSLLEIDPSTAAGRSGKVSGS